MATQLKQLQDLGTIVVADTGVTEEIEKYAPSDATTNPSLVLKALSALPESERQSFFENAIISAKAFAKEEAKSNEDSDGLMNLILDFCACIRGKQILDIFEKLGHYKDPKNLGFIGNVSTELDARLSFDAKASVNRALRIFRIYESLGVKDAKKKVLIKVATTWEGVQAAKEMSENHGIRCNMTLLFSHWQAAAAAQIANAFLISPFVGRIRDFYLKDGTYDATPESSDDSSVALQNAIDKDPGCISVRNIYHYYKLIGSKTIVMGASFRNKYEILALAGCDRLTIGPKFLKQLQESTETVNGDVLTKSKGELNEKLDVTEAAYRWGMCQDAMATMKLAEGIRNFAKDTVKLEKVLEPLIDKY